MGMSAEAYDTYWTAEMVRALIDETRPSPRYETVHGELLVTPAPNAWHQELVGRLYLALRAYVEREPVGHVFASPADISWGLPDVLVQPDVFVVPVEEARTWDWRRMTLLLAVEIVSPSSARADRFTKRRLYQERGVGTYWTIDPRTDRVEVWAPELVLPQPAPDALVWAPAGARTPFALPVAELLRR
jgi:Uma2 family endonuclease